MVAPETMTVVPGSVTPVLTVSSTVGTPTATLPAFDDIDLNGASVVDESQPDGTSLNGTQTDNGLHLGQTPGTPAAPGQDNPSNPNKPDKPDKPDKPEKPKKTK